MPYEIGVKITYQSSPPDYTKTAVPLLLLSADLRLPLMASVVMVALERRFFAVPYTTDGPEQLRPLQLFWARG
ncbi:hypothetical protein [Lactiplantibacillus paraxiangfangensis]|uniref:hypothetical protein n=1 Tax=Lactiplantibacillus paraxiangfangensis TaxID=3076224 RepID=UPI0030C6CDD0